MEKVAQDTNKLNLHGDASSIANASVLKSANMETAEKPVDCPRLNLKNIKKVIDPGNELTNYEVFINPYTNQKVYVSDSGIFLAGLNGSYFQYSHQNQIKRREKPPEVHISVINLK